MWTKNAVDDALKSYVSDKARALHLTVEIDELTRLYDAAVATLASDAAGPGAQVITGMPHGTAISNPTEQTAIRLASGWMPKELKDMQAEIKAKRAEHDMLTARVRFVEAWLEALNERENWIIKHQYIQREFWRDVIADYGKQFGGYVTKETLKGLRAKAFRAMYAAAGIRN